MDGRFQIVTNPLNTTISIKIPVVISSNGNWYAIGSANIDERIDWDLIQENLDYDNTDGFNFKSEKLFVRAEIPIPNEKIEVIECSDIDMIGDL